MYLAKVLFVVGTVECGNEYECGQGVVGCFRYRQRIVLRRWRWHRIRGRVHLEGFERWWMLWRVQRGFEWLCVVSGVNDRSYGKTFVDGSEFVDAS